MKLATRMLSYVWTSSGPSVVVGGDQLAGCSERLAVGWSAMGEFAIVYRCGRAVTGAFYFFTLGLRHKSKRDVWVLTMRH